MSELTLAEFLLARFAEDKEIACRAAFGYGGEWTNETDNIEDWSVVHADGKRDMVGCEDRDVTEHIARWDPARVLADCEAKQRIVELHTPARTARAVTEGEDYESCPVCDPFPPIEDPSPGPCETLRLLALPYREEFKP